MTPIDSRSEFKLVATAYEVGAINNTPKFKVGSCMNHEGLDCPCLEPRIEFTRFQLEMYVEAARAPLEARIKELEQKLAAAEKANQRLRSVFYINMLRCYPEKTHEELQAAIDTALSQQSSGEVEL